MTACAICPRTAPDGVHLCLVHSGELRGWLTEIPAQARLLQQEFIEPGGRPSQGRLGGTGHADAPVPVDLRVLNLLVGPGRYEATSPDDDGQAPIAATLGAWAGHIAYHYPALDWHPDRNPDQTLYVDPCDQAVPTRGQTIPGWCAWLNAYAPYALTLPLAAELHRGLGDLVRRLRALTHTEPRQDPRAAPCPVCDLCTLVRTDGRWHIHCLNCGHQMTPDDYDQHATRYRIARQAEQDDTAA